MSDYTQFDRTNPPPPLLTSEPDSFAQQAITIRIPGIIQNVIADYINIYPAEMIRALHDLYDEVTQAKPVRPLQTSAADSSDWAAAWQPHQNKSWLDLPWYFAESFFYRHLLETVSYFGSDRLQLSWAGVDPFAPRKQAELQSTLTWQVLNTAVNEATDDSPQTLRSLLHYCIWVNRIDLSYTQMMEVMRGQITLENEQTNLLVDDTEAVLAHLRPNGAQTSRRIDIISDNAGPELLLDLVLIDCLLRFNWAKQVILHVKAHPTFVSDTTPADVALTLAALKAKDEFLDLGTRLQTYRTQQRFQVRANLFWNSSHFFWEIPAPLQAELAQAHLVILKGDANYRRLLGDSRWPTTVPIGEAVPYFPAPFVALRTLKSEPIVGLKTGQAEALTRQDGAWRVNGQRGIIQAVL